MTIQEQIENALRRTNRLCDDCLSEVTGIKPRQSININCRAMTTKGSVLRTTEDCARCGRAKIVNQLKHSGEKARGGGSADLRIAVPGKSRNRQARTDPTRSAVLVSSAPEVTSKDTCFLVSCVGEKLSSAARARDLYVSDWFKKARRYVERTGQPWFILSAEHGLVHPDSVVAPYEKTLNEMGVAARRAWAARVIEQMEKALPPCGEIVVLAGARYREFLMAYLCERAKVQLPLEHLRIGEQLSWFDSHAGGAAMTRLEALQRLYDLLGDLERSCGGMRTLATCSGRMSWPERGVYFFFEPGQSRSESGSGPRVVRVGTHALTAGSKSSLWQRLAQHAGQPSGGNHRGSIFRLLIGEAMMRRDGKQEPATWGSKGDAGGAAAALGQTRAEVLSCELMLEQAVSTYVRQMPFLFVAVEDEAGPASARGVIERNAIALLSNYQRPALDAPRDQWLGRWSGRELVRESGLWNSNHVDEDWTPDFLPILAEAANRTAALS